MLNIYSVKITQTSFQSVILHDNMRVNKMFYI